MTGDFQHALRQQIREAKRQGIAHPLVVGTIPFDSRQPSALFIPVSGQFFQSGRVPQPATSPETDENRTVRLTPLPDKPMFLQMVNQAIAATASARLDKVVLARLLDIVVEKSVDISRLLGRLTAQNPDSYNFKVTLPQGDTLLGASPELLLRLEGNRYLSHPLAGSAPRLHRREQDDTAAQQLMGSRKDRHEHQLVIDSLKALLQPRSVRLTIPTSPTLMAAGSLWHLGTPVTGDVLPGAENALSLACLLHPTPALSGAPHGEAMRLIDELEPFKRDLFGGIVGWCDEYGNGEWVVTIRCARINDNRIRLFAGAGIVPESVPESEWCETGLKLDTMLRALGLSGRVTEALRGPARDVALTAVPVPH